MDLNKETAWKIFETTGNIDAYLIYKEKERFEATASVKDQGAQGNDDQHRRDGNTGASM